MRLSALQAQWLDPPVEGPWVEPGFPEEVSVADARFLKARWKTDALYSVRPSAQYREAVPRQSKHLVVHSDRYKIAHVDNFNPDSGFLGVVGHFFTDTWYGQVALILGVGYVGVYALTSFLFRDRVKVD